MSGTVSIFDPGPLKDQAIVFNSLVYVDTDPAEYPRGCDGVCNAEATAGEKHYHHKNAQTPKRGMTFI